MTSQLRLILLPTLCLLIASLAALDWVPNQMIIKTSQPRQVARGALGLPQLDSFLEQRGVSTIEPLRPMQDERWFVVSFAQPLDWAALQSQHPTFVGVEYIQPNYLNQFYATPNDPYFINQQFGLLNLPEAWDITTGSNEVVVAVVDSGLFFDHPDLQQHVYINHGEVPDNGIDDDGNGYVDDWRGWDFADAPELADIALGDFIVEDNDPTDENKHGTHVSGIICADANNSVGICGVMWNTKLMVLRAGFRTTQGTGYLQDDDCAAAIMYAADMGADVINMSWGDDFYSQVIDDACRYAYEKGAILVASAGNSASNGFISYPARLSTTLAVGGVTSYLGVAGFSIGPELDIVAPGVNILSCWDPNAEQYTEMSGTSMAAPFVSGIVGLLLSYDPGLSFEDVRARLAGTAFDLGEPGFDNIFGWGVVDAQALLSATGQPLLEIAFPYDNAGLSGQFDIIGSADCDYFFRYNIMYTTELYPDESDWCDVVSHTNTPTFVYEPVVDGVLGHFGFEPFQEDGAYQIRVQLTDESGAEFEVHRNFIVDQSPPVLTDSLMQVYRRYNGELPRYFIEAYYDESVNLRAECRLSDGSVFDVYSDYADSILIIRLPETMPQGSIDIRLEAQNRSGLVSLSDWFDDIAEIDNHSINVNTYEQQEIGAALLCLPPHEERTFVGMELIESYGPVHIFNLQGNQLIDLFTFNDHFKPLGVGDTDGECLEVLGLNLNTVTLYESPDDHGFPTDTLFVQGSVLGGTLTDYDDDGLDELILVRNLPTSRVVSLYQRSVNTFTLEADLINNTATYERNDFVPSVVVSDLDRDDTLDLLAADRDGDIMVFELYGGGQQSQMVWNTRLPVPEAYYIASGDFDGDRFEEFCVGGYTESVSDASKSYWFFGFFRPTGDNDYEMYDWLMFDTVEGQNSICAANIDDDIADELLFSLSPYLYVIDCVDGVMEPVWMGNSERSFQSILFPETDSNDMAGIVNISAGEDSIMASLMTRAQPFTGPSTPQGFRAVPQDQQSVKLTWQDSGADGYRVYRRLAGDTGSEFVGETSDVQFIDTGLTIDTNYEFAVTAVDAGFDPTESLPTLWKEATPNFPPALVSIETTSANRLDLIFDTALHTNSQNTGHFEVDHDMGRPLSVIMSSTDRRLTLTFDSAFPFVGSGYILQVKGLQGATGVAYADTNLSFIYGGDFTPPEVIAVTPFAAGRVDLEFSEFLAASAQDPACYLLIPPPVDNDNSVTGVSFYNDHLTLQLAHPLQISNQPYYLRLTNITDLAGNKLRNDQDRLRFNLADINDLSHVKIAPNPLYTQQDSQVRFFDLPLGKTGNLWIYNLSGELVFEESIGPLSETQYFVGWDARNMISKPVSSGTYFYILEMSGSYKKGTISVIR
ncbi:MAG: S8 family serine peptidase [Candidatus Cloacimonetes bacterium]|nr:S8 family serine peptidase [Candidatus Cloacimonadota bacterium]